MPRSVFQIDIKDEAFKRFLELFNSYQDDLKKMSGFWTEASEAAGGAEASVGSMATTLAATAASTQILSDAMERTSGSSQRAASNFGNLADRAKSIAGWVEHATVRLAKWGVLSLGAGLLGGGVGLYGLDRMGEGLAGQRRTAQGLGISTGELNAFGVNYGARLGLGADFLNTIQETQADLGERWKLSALGISPQEVQNADTARLTTDVIQRAHDLWRQAGPAGHNLQWMQAHGLGGIMSFNQWQQIGAQSQADLNRYAAQYQRDVRSLSVSDPVQKQWVEFVTQLKRAGEQIDTALIKGLEPIIQSNALQKLSASVVTLVDKFFGNPHVNEWIDEFSKGISKVGDYLGSDKFQSDMRTFVDDVAYAAKKIVEALQFLHLIPTPAVVGGQYGPSSADATSNLPGIHRSLEGWSSWPNLFKSPYDFDPLTRSQGLPPGMLRALAEQESSVTAHPRDQFAAGEMHQGMFQMSESMQREWGVSDPYDPDQEARATARAEADYLRRFKGNVAQAIAAWYEGPGGVQRQIDEASRRGGDWLQYAKPDVQQYVASVAQKMNIQVSVLNQTGAQVAVTANAVRQ